MKALTKITKKFRAYKSAAQAGWIASSCKTGCVIDNEAEEIRACFLHEAEISRLERINIENN